MFRYDPLPQPQPRQPIFQNAMASLLGPTMMINEMMTGQAKQKLIDQEVAKNAETKNAMAEYQRTGNLNPVMQSNPEMAIKIMDMMSKLSERDQKSIDHGIKFLDMALPMVSDPAQLGPLREDLARISPIMAQRIPPPETFQSPEQFQQWRANAIAGKEMIKSTLDAKLQYQERKIGDQIVGGLFDPRTGQWQPTGDKAPRWDQEGGFKIERLPDGTERITMGRGGGQQTVSGLPKKLKPIFMKNF